MTVILGDVKVVQTTIPSGAGTSSGVMVGGYQHAALAVPVLTSARLSFVVPGPTGGWVPIHHTASGLITIDTLGQTGNVLVAGVSVGGQPMFGGYSQEVRISAGAAQAADRTFTWFLGA